MGVFAIQDLYVVLGIVIQTVLIFAVYVVEQCRAVPTTSTID